jgi:hypothetical protein
LRTAASPQSITSTTLSSARERSAMALVQEDKSGRKPKAIEA